MKMKNLFGAILVSMTFCAIAQTENVKDLSPLLKADQWALERAAVKAVNTTVNLDGANLQALKLTYTIKTGSWPYASYPKLPAELKDWSQYKSLNLKVNAQISRADAENLVMFIAIVPTNGKRVDTTVNLVAGKWVDCAIPMEKIENPQDIKEIKFFLNGSKYQHDDVLTVEIAQMQLIK